jgi:nucleotide-binding universal stress UspA family protein
MNRKFRILIGYDGSEHSDAALEGLARAGLPDDAEAFVATVAEMWIRMPLSYGGVETSYVDDRVTGEAHSRETAQRAVGRLKERFPRWDVEFGTAVGSPSSILLVKADEWKPDLIVAGAQSRGPIARFFLGSAGQSVVNNALCSVRIVRRAGASSPMRLVVGVDGSEGAEAAVEEIAARKWPRDTEIIVASAMNYLIRSHLGDTDPAEVPKIMETEVFREESRKNADAVGRAVAMLEAAGFKVTPVIRNEDPAELLLAQAEEAGADCIFVGAKGMSRVERLLIGSVSSSVAARAECSVEVVRRNLPE